MPFWTDEAAAAERADLKKFVTSRLSCNPKPYMYKPGETQNNAKDMESTAARLRAAFRYDNDDGHEIEYQDEEEQEELIATLMKEDAERNQYYLSTLFWLTALSFPCFVVHFIMTFAFSDVLGLLSLWVSLLTVPAPSKNGIGTEYLGKKWINIQTVNICVSFALMATTWFLYFWGEHFVAGIRRPSTGPGVSEVLLSLPWAIAVIGWGCRKILEAVNFEDLHHKRYPLKGA